MNTTNSLSNTSLLYNRGGYSIKNDSVAISANRFQMLKSALVKLMLVVAIVVGGKMAWGQVVSGRTYETKVPNSMPTGWTTNALTQSNNYLMLTPDSKYIQTCEFCQNGFTSITLKARTYGGPDDSQKVITVSWYDDNDIETVLGTISPSDKTLRDYTISTPNTTTGNTTGNIKIQCKDASSEKGSGVSEVTINYTAGTCGPVTPHTVTFSAGTGTCSQAPITGSSISLPTATPPTGCSPTYTFYGWSESIVNETTTTPAIVENPYSPSADVTLYAVYRQENSGENTVRYDFSDIDWTGWSTSYAQHTINYSEAIVTFDAASKQSGTITNMPVTKGQPVSVVMNNNTQHIKEATFVCEQWGTKAQTITLEYSTDGGSTYSSTGTTSTNFTISNTSLQTGTNAVKITFSSQSNQVGISSCTIKVPAINYIYNSSPSCSCPAPTSPSVSSITQNTATISWSAGYSETNWDYYYSTSSTAPTSSTPPEGSASTTSTANISGLTANTTYYWWVRANCGGGDYSGWVSGGSFTTLNYTLSANSNDVDLGTVSVSGFVITASPDDCAQYASPAYTVTSGSATVEQVDNIFTVTPSSNCTVRINFEAKPTYNVNWIVGGSTIRTRSYCQGSTILAGDVPTAPTSGNCDGKTFIGWSAIEVPETDDEPTFATAAGTIVNGEMNYYAVFAEASEAGHAEYIKVTSSQTDWTGKYLIAYDGETFMDGALSGGTTGIGANGASIDPSSNLVGNTINTTWGDAHCLEVVSVDGGYVMKTLTGDYIYQTSNSNGMATTTNLRTAEEHPLAFSFVSENNIAISIANLAPTPLLHYNTQNSGFFRFYNNGTQNPVYMYKRSGDVTYSAYSTSCIPCEADATVSSTALTSSDITTTTATIECAGITDIGGAHCRITSYGFVYGTSTNPTIENEIEEVGTAYTTTGTAFQKEIEGLNPCTTYYVRAYATNGHGTAYGPELSFTTNSDPTITSLSILCMKNTGATISIEYTSCTTTSDIFVIAIRKGSNYPVSLGTTNPSDIAGNTEFGSGYRFGNPDLYSYVVYKGNSMPSSVTVTGLEAGNTYKLKAYRWIAEENKWTNGTTLNLALPRITSLQRDNDETSETLTWNISGIVCDGGRYVVICKEGNSDITSTCADFTSITANTVFGSGTQTQTGEYVVHSGLETSVSITGLTPGTQYMAAVFYVDAEGNCSPKAQTTFTYSRTTILEPGDLAIIAINNTINGEGNTADEFSFVIFKKITPETSIDMTDNGYGRLYEGLWGTNEGFWRITRKNSSLGAGSVITITETTGSIGYTGNGGVEPDLWNNINIYVNGVLDYDNWEINVDGPLDLNEKDQIWIMQGGEWLRDTEGGKTEHNAYYTGNVLYGYTATGWLNYYGYEGDRIPNTTEHYGTRGSVIYPSRGCFTSSLNISSGIAKFKGPFTPATKREWIIRINDEANWTGYNLTSDYISSGTNYKDNPAGPDGVIGYPLPIISDEFTKGKWSGKKSSDWCDCANWMSLVVPDENIDVEIPNVGNNNEIEIRSGNVVKCKSLTIGSSGRFRNTQENSILQVEGDITIEANGTFRPSEDNAFEIKLGGNIVSNGVFITNENTSLTLVGEESHSISAPSNGSNLKLKNLTIGQALNNFASDTIELYGNLTDNSSSSNGIELPQSLAFKGGNEQTATATEITNVTMNKSENDLTLSGELTVNEKVKFVKGNIVGNVKFESAAVAEGASTNSYIDGTVTKVASASEFSFPTGSNGVLGQMDVTSLSANTSLNFNFKEGGFSASEMPVWWNQNNICNDNGTNEKFDHVSNMYFWNLGTSSPIEDVSFTVTASDDVHFNDTSINQRNASAIKMAIYDGCWKNIGGTASTEDPYNQISMNNINLTATRAGVGEKTLSFGSIDENTILPIELVSFTANCNGRSALIEWTTATEKNNDFFVLERSNDALNFKEIARIAGAGNSIEPISYAYTDFGVRNGDNYYRLVQVDYDGTSTASEIIVANCLGTDGEPEVLAYPNPFGDDITLRFENFGNIQATVEVYDMLGRMVHTQKVNCSQNDYEVVLRLAGLSDGTYNVRISAKEFVLNKKVVKQ